MTFLILLAFATPASAVTIERVKSPGGIEAWLVRDKAVPLIAMSFTWRGGAALDPDGKEGLAEMAAGTMDEGAGELDAAAFKRALEDISASLGFSVGRDNTRGSLRTLSANRDRAFELLTLAINKPRFDADSVERVRAQMIAGLRGEEQRPGSIADTLWWKTAFPNHPYGRRPGGTAASIAALAREDLQRWLGMRLARANLLVGVVGDIEPVEFGRRLDQVFGGLPPEPAAGEVPEALPVPEGRLLVVNRPIPQAVVAFGEAGLKRADPDYYVATVMNYILGGGGFASRLTDEVRDKRGLAYSVYSHLSPMDRAGLIMGGVATQNARVKESLDVIRAEWARMAEGGATDEEIANAKTYINGSFPLQLDSSNRIAEMLVAIQLDRLGIDYIERRPSLINAVTAEDIRRVARRLLKPESLITVVVGDPANVTPTP
jgi:zinc protease